MQNQNMERLPRENPTELVAKQCLLTAQTVILLFEQLSAIKYDLELLKKDVEAFVQNYEARLTASIEA